jgi:hypothetical protein
MSWWDFGAGPDRPGGRAAPGARRSRRLWLAATGGAVTCAVLAGVAFWRVTAVPAATGPSWAPQPRQIGRLHAVAAASRTQYSLYTAHGTVHFLPGIDLGATTPGNLPGQLAITPGDYARWLDEMGALGVRAIRIYTIHPPAFYTALASYDQAHATAPIYLVQGVYLPNSSYQQTGDMYNPVATSTFRQELRDASAAVHGTLVRGRTPGRASGHWTADVSPWTAGWIIGVEWDPDATLSTNRKNPHAPAVHGRYFYSTRNASPAERWIAARMNDMATAIARTGWTVPIAFANWPTTDPLRHPNEPNPQEDLVGVDADHILPTASWPGGTFASFHAYPYYPDFLRYQMSYQHFMIDGHADPYAAYLHALTEHFRGRMPLMITEFGVPSSLGSAHTGTLGRSQGDHSEAQAMRMDASMLVEMRQLGLAGGFIFEWTDEWYKQTWNTQLHLRPLSRLQLWHDEFTNEQYFGIVATDPLPNGPPVTVYGHPRAAPITRVTAWTDASYVHLGIRFAHRPAGRLTIGLDTIPTVTGRPPPGSTDSRADFALILNPGRPTGQAWVRDQLNPGQLDYKRIPLDALPHAPGWVALELITDRPEVLPLTHTREPMEFQDAGLLRYGDWNPAQRGYDSQALWRTAGRVLWLRIPWAMAGMSDPSSHQALLPEGHYAETSVTIPGIGLTVQAGTGPAQPVGTVRWHNWRVVHYRERMKPGVSAIRRAFALVSRARVSRAARGRASPPAGLAPAAGG